MNLTWKRSIIRNLIYSARPTTLEGLHTSICEHARNYYDVLNLKKGCNAVEIRDSFITLAKKYHPDTNPSDHSCHARFIELQKAYSVLSTPSKRHEYDLSLEEFTHRYDVFTTKKRGVDVYESHYDDNFKEYFYRSRQESGADSVPSRGVGMFQVAILLLAFTSVGAIVQYLFLKWLYKRSYEQEMNKHRRATAAYYTLKEEMDKRKEECDVRKLRLTYFREVGHGAIGAHLVPGAIRGELKSEFEKKPSSDLFTTKDIKPPT